MQLCAALRALLCAIRNGSTIPRVVDHVTIRVSDRAASVRFYDTVLAPLGLRSDGDEWEDFSLAQATGGVEVTRRLHVAFFAPVELVDAFWRAGVEAGYRSDGEPGPRPQYGADYYGGFLLDPDGNSVEAVHMDRERETGRIDHLWIRVADLEASTRFYDAIAPHTGFARADGMPGTAHFRGPRATFSLVPSDEPTENVHLAFPGSREQVQAFHAAALDAGYRDNGAPGERPEYHAGYHAAFALDPDGNNVEVVDHGR